ncbi:hypothetical protein GCM10022243_05620 [Saccharothrix violaceirubra]
MQPISTAWAVAARWWAKIAPTVARNAVDVLLGRIVVIVGRLSSTQGPFVVRVIDGAWAAIVRAPRDGTSKRLSR